MNATPTARRLYLHRSSIVVALILLASTVILVVPAFSTGWSTSNKIVRGGWGAVVGSYQHGWPLVFLNRTAVENTPRSITEPLFGIPWLSINAWADWSAEVECEFHLISLLIDIAFIAIVVGGTTLAWEWRRRRRKRVFHFRLSELLLLATLLAGLLGWWTFHRNEYQREATHLHALEQQFAGVFELSDWNFAPQWMLRLVGWKLIPGLFNRTQKVIYWPSTSGSDGTFEVAMPHLRALHRLEILEINLLPRSEDYPFQAIAELQQVRSLKLTEIDSYHVIDLAVAREIAKAQQLTELDITAWYSKDVTPEARSHLANCLPNCKIIYWDDE